MKKLMIIMTLLLLFFVFMGCTDYLPTTSSSDQTTLTLPTDITLPTGEITTEEGGTTEVPATTSIPTTTEVPTTTEDNDIVLTLNPGIDTVEVFSDFTDAGATASYEEYNIQATVIENNVDTDTVGIYYIIYQANYGDKVSQIYRAVFVIDSTKPVLVLNPGIDTIVVGGSWTDAGISVTDNYDEGLTYTTTGNIDVNTIGTYTMTYIVEDTSGNEASIIRYVNIVSEDAF